MYFNWKKNEYKNNEYGNDVKWKDENTKLSSIQANLIYLNSKQFINKKKAKNYPRIDLYYIFIEGK